MPTGAKITGRDCQPNRFREPGVRPSPLLTTPVLVLCSPALPPAGWVLATLWTSVTLAGAQLNDFLGGADLL